MTAPPTGAIVHPIAIPTTAILTAHEPIAAERIVSGTPMSGLLSAYENPTKGVYAGQWVSEPGSWRVDYTEDEVCTILEGHGKLISEDGAELTFKAGDSFVIPRGFKGIWETLSRLRKIYVIVE